MACPRKYEFDLDEEKQKNFWENLERVKQLEFPNPSETELDKIEKDKKCKEFLKNFEKLIRGYTPPKDFIPKKTTTQTIQFGEEPPKRNNGQKLNIASEWNNN